MGSMEDRRKRVQSKLDEIFPEEEGFERYVFKVGSYNAVAGACFELQHPDDVMGVLLINTPTFFETTFKTWLVAEKRPEESLENLAERLPSGPITAFFDKKYAEVKQAFGKSEVIVVRDGELLPNRRPKVSMTTCGHVAGAAFFYRPPEEAFGIASNAQLTKKRRTGVSLHPKYGGYFAYRGVMLFPNVRLPSDFKEQRVPMLLDTVEKQEEAVSHFNNHWWDGKYRECGNPQQRYSDFQLKYFSTMPDKRWPLLSSWFE